MGKVPFLSQPIIPSHSHTGGRPSGLRLRSEPNTFSFQNEPLTLFSCFLSAQWEAGLVALWLLNASAALESRESRRYQERRVHQLLVPGFYIAQPWKLILWVKERLQRLGTSRLMCYNKRTQRRNKLLYSAAYA